MKKILALFVAALLCVGCLALVACGGGSVEGTYKFHSMEVTVLEKTQTYTKDDMPDEYKTMIGDFESTLEIKADGVATIKATSNGKEMTQDFTWELNEAGDQLTLKIGDVEATTYQFKGGKLIQETKKGAASVKMIMSK